MSSRLVLRTLDLGGFAPPNVLDSFAHAARRWGARFEVVDRVPPALARGGVFGTIALLHAYWRTPGAPDDCRVLALDADVLIRSDCPSPFEAVPEGGFGAVPNDQGDTHPPEKAGPGGMAPHVLPFAERLLPTVRERLPRATALLDVSRYFNGGFLVFEPERHGRALALAAEACFALRPEGDVNPMEQQTALNMAVQAAGLPLALLDRSFARLGPRAWRDGPLEDSGVHLARIFDLRDDAERRRLLATRRWLV